MRRTRTADSIAVRALRSGDSKTAGQWIRDKLPTVTLERLPAPIVRHPLDFTCFPLYRHGNLGLCLHVWPEDDESTSPIIHAHSWDLWSYVACGTVQNQTMSVHDETETPEYRLYTVASVGGVDDFQPTGRLVTCTSRQRQEISSGEIYRLPAAQFHRSGHRGLTATLVLGEQQVGMNNLVLGSPDNCPRSDSPREECSPDEARAVLRRVARFL